MKRLGHWAFNIVAGVSLAACIAALLMVAAGRFHRQSVRQAVSRQGPVVRQSVSGFEWNRHGIGWGGYEVYYLLGVSYHDRYSLTGRASAEDLRDAAELSQRVRSC